ncbi:hypothetical protein T01_2599 [Trichinella spiralis]|uniref:Uncharacterized protein n=1 Tax=Trichinella spiralis TaxID=6334 RepID=A0A0V1AJ35_TRISP|nr:hypothetical protein T01_2599 [Trichinella spiralis]
MQYALQKGRSIAATTEDFMPIFDLLLERAEVNGSKRFRL